MTDRVADVTVNADDLQLVLDTAMGFSAMTAKVYDARLRLRAALESKSGPGGLPLGHSAR